MHQDQQKETTEQIWRELSDRLRQFVRSRVASTADVEDLLQTVFLRIHASLKDLRQTEKLQSWVFQITRNAITDHFRKNRDTQGDVDLWPDDSDRDDSDHDDLDHERAEDAMTDLVACLRALIEQLPDDQRRAVSMYELDGVSQKEIATREAISLSGAKSRIQRGRKSLETLLKACCQFQLDRRGNVVDYEATNPNCCKEECG